MNRLNFQMRAPKMPRMNMPRMKMPNMKMPRMSMPRMKKMPKVSARVLVPTLLLILTIIMCVVMYFTVDSKWEPMNVHYWILPLAIGSVLTILSIVGMTGRCKNQPMPAPQPLTSPMDEPVNLGAEESTSEEVVGSTDFSEELTIS